MTPDAGTMGNKNERRKQVCSQVIQTVLVTWALAMVGISDSLLGPSLLDLQALLQTDLGMLNYIVLATGLFDFVGAILAGFLAKTADVHLRLCISLSIGALVISMSAMVANYYYVLVAFSLQGLLRGIVFCYSIEKGNGIWKNKGVSFQIIVLGPSMGGVIAPLVVNGFLCTAQHTEAGAMSYNSSALNNSNAQNNVTLSLETHVAPSIVNLTNSFVPHTTNDTSLHSAIPEGQCLPQDVKISYAYIILGIISVLPVVGFFVYWRGSKGNTNDNVDSNITSKDNTNEVESNTTHHGKLALLFSVLFVIYYFPILGGSILYSTFLTDFGVKGPLHIDKSKMVLMTSLYWGSSVAGRILNIILTPCLGVEKVIIVNIIPLLIFETILVAAVSQSEILLWVCTCAIGVFISPYTGAGFAWCAGLVKLSPKIISASSASLALGGTALPFIGGVLIQSFGSMSFMYFLYAIYIFVAVMFLIMFILSRRLKQDPTSTEVSVDPSSQPLTENDL